jgi:hypothetical protein
LVRTQAVVSHLPETRMADRNQLISAMYVQMARRMDHVLAGSLAGQPYAPGYPGANWMMLAPFASHGIHDPIAGDFKVFGLNNSWIIPDSVQAAADGNQWIFDDVGRRYAAFIQMYEHNPHPPQAELERYFTDNFSDGDAHIRAGMAAYSEVMHTTDPVRRQELMYQGNVLIATHEQSGAQPWLEKLAPGPQFPDTVITRYLDLQVGDRPNLQVDQDLRARGPQTVENNLILDRPFLGLDPGSTAPQDIAPGALGNTHLPAMQGVEKFDPTYPRNIGDAYRNGALADTQRGVTHGYLPDPDTEVGSAAPSWLNRSDRQYYLDKLFELRLTDPGLFEPEKRIPVGFGHPSMGWVDPRTGLR